MGSFRAQYGHSPSARVLKLRVLTHHAMGSEVCLYLESLTALTLKFRQSPPYDGSLTYDFSSLL